MKVVILCGGFGSRLGKETSVIPKPLVKIDKDPILIHILKLYYKHGYNDFILCIWSILLPLYILLLSCNDVLNIYLKLSPLNVEPYEVNIYK